MRASLTTIALLIALLASVADGRAQKATEQFIPIGQSPGLSSIATDIGTIAAADPGSRTITLGPAASGRRLRVTEGTRIWLDRSGFGQTNRPGRFDDLETGQRVEVKYEDDTRRETAEWIKVVPRTGG